MAIAILSTTTQLVVGMVATVVHPLVWMATFMRVATAVSRAWTMSLRHQVNVRSDSMIGLPMGTVTMTVGTTTPTLVIGTGEIVAKIRAE